MKGLSVYDSKTDYAEPGIAANGDYHTVRATPLYTLYVIYSMIQQQHWS